MGKSKSERHHWWPECVSRHWADDKGGVHWLLPDGSQRRAKPSAFGVIGNGHFIKLGHTAGAVTPWDQNFEDEFQNADISFPAVICWLEGLYYEARFGQERRERFVPQSSSDAIFEKVVECLTSLAIRSPMTRSAAVRLAEEMHGPLSERERNALIAGNLRGMHRRAVQAFSTRGKITVIISDDKEFIFGDGFYHNINSLGMAPRSPRILAPITPKISVLYARPRKCVVEPRVSTLVIDRSEAEVLNAVVQIYAREAIFYRSDKPMILPEFKVGEHLCFSSYRNIVEMMIHDMPGVPPRNATFGFIEDLVFRS